MLEYSCWLRLQHNRIVIVAQITPVSSFKARHLYTRFRSPCSGISPRTFRSPLTHHIETHSSSLFWTPDRSDRGLKCLAISCFETGMDRTPQCRMCFNMVSATDSHLPRLELLPCPCLFSEGQSQLNIYHTG